MSIMKILYVIRGTALGDTGRVMAERGHDLVSRKHYADALAAILTGNFHAVIVENRKEDLEALDFIVKAHYLEPTLPIFVAKDWGAGLPEAIEEFANASDVIENHVPCCPGFLEAR